MILEEALAALDGAGSVPDAKAAIWAFAAALGMPKVAWSPDVSRPVFSAAVDRFLNDSGWPPEMQDLWWNRAVMLKIPLYIRCRTHSLPFAVNVSSIPASAAAEIHRMGDLVNHLGITSFITVPVHLPRGRVAMLAFGGAQDGRAVQALLTQYRSALIAAGYLFAEKFAAEYELSTTEGEKGRITPREWECLRLIAQGHREAEVAELLNIKKTTVRYHIDNAVGKLGATNRSHAIAVAAQLGILGPIG